MVTDRLRHTLGIGRYASNFTIDFVLEDYTGYGLRSFDCPFSRPRGTSVVPGAYILIDQDSVGITRCS